ncbi:hypothetical protein RHECNPAF_1360033 [Rhizobium etli CNPAF512]|nr:hypothetical protein RHECNPAF_1360033 [Rhizobium etli CNPAF512]
MGPAINLCAYRRAPRPACYEKPAAGNGAAA